MCKNDSNTIIFANKYFNNDKSTVKFKDSSS